MLIGLARQRGTRGHTPAHHKGALISHENFAGMKPAVNETLVVRFVQGRGQGAQSRDQVFNGGGTELTQRRIERDAARRRRIRKGSGIIQSGVVSRAFVVQIKV